MYRIWLKNFQFFDTDENGNITYDSERHYRREPDSSWKILGFARRHNTLNLVTLADAVKGRDIGHGFVHDLDHGTQRMWSHPSNRRAVKVEVIK